MEDNSGHVGGGVVVGGRVLHLYEGRDGVLCFDGDPGYFEEWEQRSQLKLEGILEDEEPKTELRRKQFLIKMVGGLSGNAWTHCKGLKVCSSKHIKDPDANSSLAFEEICKAVQSATQDVAPLRLRKFFREYFRNGGRRKGVSLQDFIKRREDSYERMRQANEKIVLPDEVSAFSRPLLYRQLVQGVLEVEIGLCVTIITNGIIGRGARGGHAVPTSSHARVLLLPLSRSPGRVLPPCFRCWCCARGRAVPA